MKRSIAAAVAVIILATSLCGCGKNSRHSTYREIYQRYSQMESFYAAATVTVRSDKTESVYSVRQFYEAPDKFAFVVDAPDAVAGSGYTAKGGQLLLKSGFGDKAAYPIAFPEEKNYMFLCDFFEEYCKSEENAVEASGALGGNSTTLTCFTQDRSKERFKQSLSFDNKTYLPLVLETYDISGEPVLTVEFLEFKRNCDIDEAIFD